MGSIFLRNLYLGYGLILVALTGIVGWVATEQLAADAEAQIRARMSAEAGFLRELFLDAKEADRLPALQDRVRSLAPEIDTRLTLILESGVVLADSAIEDPSTLPHHRNRPEVLDAERSGIGFSKRHSVTMQTDLMYAAVPIRSDGNLLGFARAATPLSILSDLVSRLRRTAFLTGLAAVVVALTLGHLFGRKLNSRISKMVSAAESVALGDDNRSLQAHPDDELGKLAMAFNQVTRESRERLDIISTDKNKLLAILGSMVEGVIAVDRDEQVIHLNHKAAEVLQIDQVEAPSKRLWELTRNPEIQASMLRALTEGKPGRTELRLESGERPVVVELLTSALRDSKGSISGAVGVLHDITEIHRLETIRRDFVANASHELKTPITAIRGLIETLIEDPKIDPATRTRFQERISVQADRLTALVSDLLTLSQLESMTRSESWSVMDLRNTLTSSLKTIAQAVDERNMRLEVRSPEQPVRVRGDAQALAQALRNLLDNAIKYTPDGGQIQVELRTDDGQALFSVRDDGIGIEERHLNRIFERFYRVDKARSRVLGGTGLGLAIVKHMAQVHGGQVSVESHLGKGSTFQIQLPLAENE